MTNVCQHSGHGFVVENDCGAYVVSSMSYTTSHHSASVWCFAVRCFSVNQMIGIYYGSLVYTGLSEKNGPTKEYAKGMICVTTQTSQRRAIDFQAMYWLPIKKTTLCR